MNVQPLSTLLADYSPIGNGSDNEFMDALGAASWQQVSFAQQQASVTASARAQEIGSLQNTVKTAQSLPKTKDGTRVVLGETLTAGADMKASLQATGTSLNTEESYYIAIGTGAKYVASAAERAAIAGGTLVGTPTADGVETRAVTSGSTTTNYLVYTKEHVLTASVADVNTAVAGIQVQIAAKQKLLGTDLTRLQALTASVNDFSKQLSDGRRKREKQTGENKQDARDQNFNVAAELRRNRIDLLVARDTRTTKP